VPAVAAKEFNPESSILFREISTYSSTKQVYVPSGDKFLDETPTPIRSPSPRWRIITNEGLADSLRKWHTVPVYKSPDGIRAPLQIARSLPFDFRASAARWAAIHPRKQRSVPSPQFAIRAGFLSRAFSYPPRYCLGGAAIVLGSAFFVKIVPNHSAFGKRNDSRVTFSSSRNAVSLVKMRAYFVGGGCGGGRSELNRRAHRISTLC
jgi:hypothetical protein